MHIHGDFLTYFNEKNGYYNGKCGMCSHYKLNEPTRYGCKCDVRTRKGLAFDDTCRSQRDDRYRSQKDIKKAFEKIRVYTPEIYYIATAVRDILNTPESKVCFVLIKQYRDKRVQNELRFYGDLVSYDIYGRLVADAIRKDKKSEEIANILLTNFLKPTCQFILEDRIDEAVAFYRYGVVKLKELYQIPDIQNYNFENISSLSDEDIARVRLM